MLDIATHEELKQLVELMENHRQALELRIAQQNVIVNAAIAFVECTQADICNSEQIDTHLQDLVRTVKLRNTYGKSSEIENDHAIQK